MMRGATYTYMSHMREHRDLRLLLTRALVVLKHEGKCVNHAKEMGIEA